MALAYAESEDPANLPMAKEILEYLVAAYPGHSWWTRIDGGVVIIKHFAISGTIGMVRHMSQISHDANVRKRDVLRAAGELLERAGLRRVYEGEAVTRLEGAEKMRWQPRGDTGLLIHTLDGTIH